MKMILPLRMLAFLFALCCLFHPVLGLPASLRGRELVDNGNEHRAQRERALSSDSKSNDVGRLPSAPLPQQPQTFEAVAPPPPRANDVVEAMIRRGGFQTLIKLLFTAGLVDDLKTAGPFTIFAPNNRALPSGQALADFVVSEPLADLRAVLSYHVVPGLIRSTDLVDGAQLTTLEGRTLTVSLANGAMINNARVGFADIEAENGIIHTIDNMLMVF